MQEHGLAVEVEDVPVVGPGLLLEAPVGLHQRSQGPELCPADQQLGLAALRQPAAEVAADVVREVREPGRGAREQRGEQRAQRPEVGCLVTAPEHSGRLLTGPAGAAEEHAPTLAVDRVEGLLGRVAIEPPVFPGRLGARPAIGQPRIRREVIALAVIGLDSFHAELEDRCGTASPTSRAHPGR